MSENLGYPHNDDPAWKLRCKAFALLEHATGSKWRIWKQRICREDDPEHNAIMTEWHGIENAKLVVFLRNNIAKILAHMDGAKAMLSQKEKEIRNLITGIQVVLDGSSEDDPLVLATNRREEQIKAMRLVVMLYDMSVALNKSIVSDCMESIDRLPGLADQLPDDIDKTVEDWRKWLQLLS